MRKAREEEVLFGNLTAMIDVVFQIIIFFVCTSNMQDSALDARIKLALAPHGTAVAKKDPLQIVVDVNGKGGISIARTPIHRGILNAVFKKAVAEFGNEVPVCIRGDAKASHLMIRNVMDTAAGCGIWKIKIVALKEKGS